MIVRFAWASISENGTVNGKKGDQTGREVKIGNYYDFGQTQFVRLRNRRKRKRMSAILKKLCRWDGLGYGQSDRISLYNFCKGCNWNWETVKKKIEKGKAPKCNCDCSSLVVCAFNLTYGKPKLNASVYTGNLYSALCGENSVNCKRIREPKKVTKFHMGDIVIKQYGHVITCVEGRK